MNWSPPERASVSPLRIDVAEPRAPPPAAGGRRGDAEAVVDALEAVEVDGGHGHLAPAALGGGDGLPHAIAQQRAVGEPGERVGEGEALDELLVALALGHVGHDGDAAVARRPRWPAARCAARSTSRRLAGAANGAFVAAGSRRQSGFDRRQDPRVAQVPRVRARAGSPRRAGEHLREPLVAVAELAVAANAATPTGTWSNRAR